MYQIKTYNAIAQEGLDQFTADYQINQTDTPDAYLIRSVNLQKADFPEQLKVIARCGAGFNNIPLTRVTKQGIAAFNTPGSNSNAVKELVISMLIASSRNLFQAAAYSAQNGGADISMRTEKEKTQFNGTELLGKTLAVIGVGHVGSLVANAANALGMRVVGYDPYLSADAAWRISTKIQRANTLEEAIANADYVSLHVPKNEETTGMINATVLAKMKPNAVLLNYARGEIVNLDDTLAALDQHHLGQFMTDFGDDRLLNRDDVVITPHIGGSTGQAEANGAIQGAQTIMEYLETGNITNSVNLPNLQVPFESRYRLTLIHENIPNMVGQIATLLANANINIETMSNAARGDVAYTIIDVDHLQEVQEAQLEADLNKIPAVYRTRLLTK
ncbi:D-3-phosphoglycerate dehydrogenase [Secundilactobacillus oryzae JCM 18671]|uniref:D-3-phosphoglycerate dehydrogenase n=1 Tax=Secundilactobacillus oryzae JCM 18671 TaxID=1291743 RepID=A0A081BG97_9LACO|nr:phosphoglycerate dehydrogenase [Secundilactobacillus oryzae]GAK47065.1 D-3-phosphoglycerate dehydrogenase [Secundilactobacillus oryzae JCM 18671]